MSSSVETGNRLGDQNSPYLLQHADNPVHWQPWDSAALEQARRTGRPILLSVGYAACHWCHVMAHESFEDPQTARLMNELFVNIKVDREERPDLDRIYQTAQQLLNGRPGGWPLTAFLDPQTQAPYFVGTYFPPAPRHGMPAFGDLLRKAAQVWHEHREDIAEQNRALVEALARLDAPHAAGAASLTPAPLDAARDALGREFDAERGGFGGAPKFPHPTHLQRLLRHHAATREAGAADEGALAMAAFTLAGMAEGGIRDQLGGGFYRYSVDAQWMIPHFEKMLYDNAQLLALYAWGWQATGNRRLRDCALGIATWAREEMRAPSGAFYSSLDADSPQGEGAYYVWTPAEARALLEPAQFAAFAHHYGLDREPNFEGRAWHLHTFASLEETARGMGVDVAEAGALVEAARTRLLAARARRTRPGRDEKILCSWNALMIGGLATAGRVLDLPWMIACADEALGFLRSHLWRDGRLLAAAREERGYLGAYLDDYAFLIEALLALLEARWRTEDLRFAMRLADTLLDHFEDTENGGFYFTADDHERLLHRSRPLMDEAVPAGAAVAARALGRLGHLLGESRYLEAAERALQAAWPALERAPHAHEAMLDALEDYLLPPEIIVLRGAPGPERERWLRCARSGYRPMRLCFAIDAGEADLPGLLGERRARGASGVTAYLCRGHRCEAPTEAFAEFEAALARRA